MTYEVKQLKENELHDFCLKIHQSNVIVVCLRNGMTRIEFFVSWLWSYRRWNTDQFEPCQKLHFLENQKRNCDETQQRLGSWKEWNDEILNHSVPEMHHANSLDVLLTLNLTF